MEFKYVDAEINGTHKQILVSRDSGHVTCPVDICCTSYCEIVVSGKQHQVFWKWTQNKDEPMTTSTNDITPGHTESSEEDDDNNTEHTLPFKVMGVAYSAQRQKHLENAFQIVRERNVLANIVPESDNPYDKHAIAVMLDYGQDWSKIGYISKELTRFLHPLLKHCLITNVSLKHINFRTNYLRVGFYATIQVTRKGQWENSVIKASKRVM